MTEWVDTLCKVCEFTSADDGDDDGRCCYSNVTSIVTKTFSKVTYNSVFLTDFLIIFSQILTRFSVEFEFQGLNFQMKLHEIETYKFV